MQKLLRGRTPFEIGGVVELVVIQLTMEEKSILGKWYFMLSVNVTQLVYGNDKIESIIKIWDLIDAKMNSGMKLNKINKYWDYIRN